MTLFKDELKHTQTLETSFTPYSKAPFFTLTEMLESRASLYPNKVAFRFLDYSNSDSQAKEITYEEFQLEAKRLSVLISGYAEPGERALLLYRPSPHYYIALFACMYAGVIAVPAYPPENIRGFKKIENIVTDCTPMLALAGSEFSSILETHPLLEEVRVIDTEKSFAGLEHSYKQKEITQNDLAFLQYTSGSTGNPKGVMLTHGNLISNLLSMSGYTQLTPEDSYVTWLPPYHDLGLIGGILLNLYSGTSATVMSPFDFIKSPIRWLEAIDKYKATISGGPNFSYELCVKRIDDEAIKNLDLSSWKIAYSGAEPVRKTTFEAFAQRFASNGFEGSSLSPCYGLAESTLFVSSAPRGTGFNSLDIDLEEYSKGKATPTSISDNSINVMSVGQIDDSYELRIVDSQDLPLEDGKVGEIVVSGPSVAQGYWNNMEKTEEDFGLTIENRKYLRTGDYGFIHDNELYISGRKKDVLIYKGVNYYPQDIERISEQTDTRLRPGCCACFMDGHDENEGIILLQEVRRSANDIDESVAKSIASAISQQFSLKIKEVHLVEQGELPKTSSGKICRQPAKAMHLASEFTYITSLKL